MDIIIRSVSLAWWLLLVAQPTHAQWVQTNGPAANQINCLAVDGTDLYAGTSLSGLYRSSDGGTTWTEVVSWIGVVYSLAVVPNGQGGTSIFAGTWGYYVFVSNDHGASWTQRSAGLGDGYIYALAVAPDGTLFAGTGYHGVHKSVDGGVNWIAANTGLKGGYFGIYVTSLAVVPDDTGGRTLYAGIQGYSIFRSSNDGTTWTDMGLRVPYYDGTLQPTCVFAFATVPGRNGGTDLFAGTYGINAVGHGYFGPDAGYGVYRLGWNETSWNPANNGLTNGKIISLVASDMNLFVGTYDGGIYLSSANHIMWKPINSGMPIREVHALAIAGNMLFAGTWGAGVWKRLLFDATAVEFAPVNVPTHFGLEQNYPNPFNPSTTITFHLASRSYVTLKVFDALAREVSNLISEDMHAGTYTREWNAAALPSGVYYYRLQAGSFTETKKLILLR